MKYGETYYWFGEHKADTTSSAMVGVMCYASEDLINWRNCGVALSVSDEKGNDIERGCILERPKVIYNKVTKKFCMWFHLELKGLGYSAARYGVAVSERPEGPYKFLYSQRANAGTYPVEFAENEKAVLDTLNPKNYEKWWTPEWAEAIKEGLFLKRDFSTGQMARDMTLYIDDDGKAYHIFSSEDNLTLHIAELTNDYLHHTGRYTRVAPCGQNEAPAIFKKDGTYWMITSGLHPVVRAGLLTRPVCSLPPASGDHGLSIPIPASARNRRLPSVDNPLSSCPITTNSSSWPTSGARSIQVMPATSGYPSNLNRENLSSDGEICSLKITHRGPPLNRK